MENKINSTIIKQTVITQARRLHTSNDSLISKHSTPVITESPIETNINDELRIRFAQELNDLKEEARQLGLKQAAQEAVTTLNQLKEQLQAKHRTEEKILKSNYQTLAQQLIQLTESINTQKEQLFEQMYPLIVRISFEVISKILSESMTNKSLVELLAKQAISIHKLNTVNKIHISRKDFEQLQLHLDSSDLHKYYQIDELASVGSCLIELDNGKVDASLKTQLMSIIELLMKSLESVDKSRE